MINEWVSIVSGFETESDFKKFVDIISEIGLRDETIKFVSSPEKMKVYILLDDFNQLHKKSLWMISKTDVQGLKYSVRSKTGSILREIAFDKLR